MRVSLNLFLIESADSRAEILPDVQVLALMDMTFTLAFFGQVKVSVHSSLVRDIDKLHACIA